MRLRLEQHSFPFLTNIYLVAGPILAILVYCLLPDTFVPLGAPHSFLSHEAKACLAVASLMIFWWATNTIPMGITALIPIVAFPLLGVVSSSQTLVPYANSFVFLIIGSLLLSNGIHRSGLDRRVGLHVLNLFGTSTSTIIATFLYSTALLSMFISNTAACCITLPSALYLVHLMRQLRSDPISEEEKNFGALLLLGIAFGASIGGNATLIGSEPNNVYTKYIFQVYGAEMSGLEWTMVGFPLIMIMLPLTWILLTKVLFIRTVDKIPVDPNWSKCRLDELGPLSPREKGVLGVLLLSVALWIAVPFLREIQIGKLFPFKSVGEAAVAMFSGILLYCIPVSLKKGETILRWQDRLPLSWNVVLLFGGGFSLANALVTSGAADYLISFTSCLEEHSRWVVLLGFSTLTALLSNVIPNSAMATDILPLFAPLAPDFNIPAQTLLLAVVLAASASFILPAATPPNAIVFSLGHIRISQMIRAGSLLTVVSLFIIASITFAFGAEWAFLIE